MSKITNIGVERELTGSENERRKGYKREERNVWRKKVEIKVSSCSETERRNRMLLKAAFNNG